MSLQNKGVNLITILNVYALNNRASKYLKQKLTELKEKIMDELNRAEQQIAQNGNAKIIFFDLCLQMIVLVK